MHFPIVGKSGSFELHHNQMDLMTLSCRERVLLKDSHAVCYATAFDDAATHNGIGNDGIFVSYSLLNYRQKWFNISPLIPGEMGKLCEALRKLEWVHDGPSSSICIKEQTY